MGGIARLSLFLFLFISLCAGGQCLHSAQCSVLSAQFSVFRSGALSESRLDKSDWSDMSDLPDLSTSKEGDEDEEGEGEGEQRSSLSTPPAIPR
jgi:hypothetical protein